MRSLSRFRPRSRRAYRPTVVGLESRAVPSGVGVEPPSPATQVDVADLPPAMLPPVEAPPDLVWDGFVADWATSVSLGYTGDDRTGLVWTDPPTLGGA